MVEEIELGKWYKPHPDERAVCFWSVNSDGEFNYSIEGIRTFLPLFCTRQQALEMANGATKKVYP